MSPLALLSLRWLRAGDFFHSSLSIGDELPVVRVHESTVTMQYLLLIQENEKIFNDMSPEEQGRMMADYMTYTASLKQAGVFVGGNALQPVDTATTVRVRNGKRTLTDGPFAETAEQLGGYYLIDVPNLDQALDWAAKVPSAGHGSIEVRPIMTFDQPT